MRAKELGGEITYLRQGEIDARNRGYSPYSLETWRAWEYWANKAGCGHMLSKGEHAHAHKKGGTPIVAPEGASHDHDARVARELSVRPVAARAGQRNHARRSGHG